MPPLEHVAEVDERVRVLGVQLARPAVRRLGDGLVAPELLQQDAHVVVRDGRLRVLRG